MVSTHLHLEPLLRHTLNIVPLTGKAETSFVLMKVAISVAAGRHFCCFLPSHVLDLAKQLMGASAYPNVSCGGDTEHGFQKHQLQQAMPDS